MSQVKYFNSFTAAIANLHSRMVLESFEVHPSKWQGLDVQAKPEARMKEILFPSFQVPVSTENVADLALQIRPSLPWADRHFMEERVSGQPINPGDTWKIWPWANSADKFRTEGEQYNHSYAERYWPKYAGRTPGGLLQGATPTDTLHYGIRYAYGDLNDVVSLLEREPLTRQAYLPVFFPEDTGAVHGARIPCSIGYHFMRRGEHLHMVYQLRSCDFYRHFRDDVYLSVRLQLWVLDQLRKRDERWDHVKPGLFIMHISSLHVFINDWMAMKGNPG